MKRFGIALAIALAALIGWGIYGELTKPPMKPQRLPCQKEVSCFERAYTDQAARDRVIDLLAQRAYRIETSTRPSVYMPSRLFDTLDPVATEAMVRAAIARHLPLREKNGGDTETVVIDYLIYENDMQDPGKKSKKAFLYQGYVVLGFKYAGTIVYKVQIDFMEPMGKDIERRIDCAIQSFITFDKEL